MIVLITGASAGFGEEMARKFIRQGHQVIAAARRVERLEKLHQELGDKLLPIGLDVTDKASVDAALSALPQDFQPIDVLINNAGLALGTEAAQHSRLDEWETMIATNIRGLVTLTHALLPGMVARASGLIINLVRRRAIRPTPAAMFMGPARRLSNSSRVTCAPIWSEPACAPPIWPPACAAERSSRMCAFAAMMLRQQKSMRAPCR